MYLFILNLYVYSYSEARQHGAGFYSFSKDEEERAKQMEELETIRKQTEAARKQTAQTNSDKQLALEARLKKVRDRKRQKLGLPPLSKNRFSFILSHPPFLYEYHIFYLSL